MRKRQSKPKKFAAIDNQAVDSISSLLSLGVLTRLIRAQDGTHITVETMVRDYDEGEVSVTKAMRRLVNDGYVVKYKIQRARQTTVTEDGRPVTKKGGSWYTIFDVDTEPYTREEVGEALDAILADGNARAVRIEPERLDPRKPADPASSDPASSDPHKPRCRSRPAETPQNSRSAPTPRFPGVGDPVLGDPTPGEDGALFKTRLSETGSKTPHSSSVVVREPVADAGGPVTPRGSSGSAEPHRDRPQERPGGRGDEIPSSNDVGGPVVDQVSVQEGPEGPQDASEGVRAFVAALPGMTGPHVTSQGPLLPLVAAAFASGWSEGALRSEMAVKVDPSKAKDPSKVPGWYATHLSKLGPPPPAPAPPAPPLCDVLAHQRHPTSDPVKGGCQFCNTAAARAASPGVLTESVWGPRGESREPARPVEVPPQDSREIVPAASVMNSALAAMRGAVANRPSFESKERSRKQTPAQRALDEAEQKCEMSNSLL